MKPNAVVGLGIFGPRRKHRYGDLMFAGNDKTSSRIHIKSQTCFAQF